MREAVQNDFSVKNIISNLKWAAIIGFLVVLPFLILELINNQQSFPAALFGFLWLLSMAFIGIVMPVAQNIRAGNCVAAKPFNLLVRIAFSALIAALWLSLVIDQLPCFLGVPNCD